MSVGAPCIYVVRCNFAGSPQDEVRWNDWYNGPKLADMLAKPLFLAGQRFRAVGLDGSVRYLAVWHLAGPEALETDVYGSSWGFADWAGSIVDWSRDLYVPAEGPAEVAVPLAGQVLVRAYTTAPIDQPAQLGRTWLRSSGLDGTWATLAVEVRTDAPPTAEGLPTGDVAWETLFEPLTPFSRSG